MVISKKNHQKKRISISEIFHIAETKKLSENNLTRGLTTNYHVHDATT